MAQSLGKQIKEFIFLIIYDLIYIAFCLIFALVFSLVPGFKMDVPQIEGGKYLYDKENYDFKKQTNVNVLYPYRKSVFPELEAAIIIYLPTFLIIFAFAFKHRNLKHTAFSCLALVAAISTWFLFCEGGKKYAGRPRPNMVAYAQQQGKEEDAWKSFPSAHSAAAFCGFTFLSLFLAGELQVFSRKPQLWRLLPVVIPLFLAGIVVVTRTRDYYHNFSDVVAGSLIGMFSSIICYAAKFESIFSKKSGEIRENHCFLCGKDEDEDDRDEEMVENSSKDE